MVPREPTKEMVKAAWVAGLGRTGGFTEQFMAEYQSALAAAPEQPAQEPVTRYIALAAYDRAYTAGYRAGQASRARREGWLKEAARLIRLRKNVGNAEYERQCEDWLNLAEGRR